MLKLIDFSTLDLDKWGKRLSIAANVISAIGLVVSLVLKIRILMGAGAKSTEDGKSNETAS
jgi:hypothetical protein